MVLSVRIELTTSALPRMRSTTELRQHVRGRGRYGQSNARLSTRLASDAAGDRAMPMSKADQQRADRLAAALGENLRRRKSQARAAEPEKPPRDAG